MPRERNAASILRSLFLGRFQLPSMKFEGFFEGDTMEFRFNAEVVFVKPALDCHDGRRGQVGPGKPIRLPVWRAGEHRRE
jgi:hypothetical protein